MKYKRGIVAGVAALTVVTSGTVMALTHDNPPLPTKTAQTSQDAGPNSEPPTTNQQEDPAMAPAADQTPTTVTPQVPAITSTPTPAENRTKLQDAVTDAANTVLLHLPTQDKDSFIAVQWACVDKLVSLNQGYGDYDALLTNSAYTVFNPIHNEDGTTVYQYFDNPGSCRIFTTDPS